MRSVEREQGEGALPSFLAWLPEGGVSWVFHEK